MEKKKQFLLFTVVLLSVSAAAASVKIAPDNIYIDKNPLAFATSGETQIGYSNSILQTATITDQSNDTVAETEDQHDAFKVRETFILPVGTPPWE
jgi:hypothetical protein